jgi:small subunit ribosomal protein S11
MKMPKKKEIEKAKEEKETKNKKSKPDESKDENKNQRSKEEKSGIAHIFSTGNNTIVHITDLAGNTISRISGGMVTKHSRLKANPTIAMFVAKKASERARDLGIKALYIKLKGKTTVGNTGPGAHAAVKALGKEGFRVINILDATKYPRGGPKQKGGKRGRRV